MIKFTTLATLLILTAPAFAGSAGGSAGVIGPGSRDGLEPSASGLNGAFAQGSGASGDVTPKSGTVSAPAAPKMGKSKTKKMSKSQK